MENKPLISVFVPYYNDKDVLRDCIDSVLTQTYDNFELILFNHASTDGSRDIAHSYNDNRIIHIDAEKNLGAGSGGNITISLPYMKGEYIKLLCADDMLKHDALENLVNCFKANPDKDIVFADMDYVDEKCKPLNTTWSKEIPKVDFVSDEKETLKKFFQGYSHIAYPAAMIKMEAIKDIAINNTFIMLFDVSLWIKLLIKGKKIVFFDKSVVNYRISDNQMSSCANSRKAVKIGYFELFQLLNIYYEIKDVELIKYLCPCEFSELLQKGDEEFIPFILSYFFASVLSCDRLEYFKDQQSVREIFGCTKLYEIMQDSLMAEKIEKKFGFGIKEFRAIYSHQYQGNNSNILNKIFNKKGRDLSVLQTFILFAIKLLHVLKPSHYVKIWQKIIYRNKKYTV